MNDIAEKIAKNGSYEIAELDFQNTCRVTPEQLTEWCREHGISFDTETRRMPNKARMRWVGRTMRACCRAFLLATDEYGWARFQKVGFLSVFPPCSSMAYLFCHRERLLGTRLAPGGAFVESAGGMFVDHIKVHVKGGDGGSGMVSFRREKFVPKGGPDGGDGGRGGDVILRADSHTDNLANFFYEPIIKAKDGEKGGSKNCYGKAARAKIVPVPIGTLVYRLPSTEVRPAGTRLEMIGRAINLAREIDLDEPAPAPPLTTGTRPAEDLELLADLTEAGQEFVICAGGQGGKGNVHFKSSKNRVPREYTPGEAGEEGDFFLELRTIADAGFVGYPNAGKSTLLGKISAAHPKVAAYPFTTLHPIIGVVEFPGFARATVADIPGLIEGAHLNVGLGHEFLRHIVRCKLLLFVVDMAGSEGRSPLDDLGSLRQEIKLYDPTLADRPWLVIANKMDLPEAAENLKAFKRRFRKREVIPVSAAEEEGLAKLKNRLREIVLNPASAVEFDAPLPA